MKINEILVESQNLEEGPILNKIGSAVGKGVGTLAKGGGAVAGGIAGIGKAAKKGYMAGLQTVSGAGDDEEDAAEPSLKTAFKAGQAAVRPAAKAAAAPAPTASPAPAATTPAAAPAKPAAAPSAQAAPAPTAAAPAAQPSAATQTVYAQIKSNIDKLDKKGKQRILAALNKELGATPAPATPAAPSAMGQMASQLGATPAKSGTGGTITKTPTGVVHTASPTNPNQPAAKTAPAAPAVKKAPVKKPKAKPVSALNPAPAA